MNKALAALLVAGMTTGCAADLRKGECRDMPTTEYEACMTQARDPAWEREKERRRRLAGATTAEEKRKAKCEALREPELSRCLVGAREPEE